MEDALKEVLDAQAEATKERVRELIATLEMTERRMLEAQQKMRDEDIARVAKERREGHRLGVATEVLSAIVDRRGFIGAEAECVSRAVALADMLIAEVSRGN